MKHTGGETTTSVGRYDTSLGDFRLGEDYDEVYPLADFRKIPLLLDNLCRTTDVQLTEAGVSENIKIVANFMYDFMHIKPFGYCNLETGILLINFLELKEEHPLLILFADDRAELLNALKRGKSVRHRKPSKHLSCMNRLNSSIGKFKSNSFKTSIEKKSSFFFVINNR